MPEPVKEAQKNQWSTAEGWAKWHDWNEKSMRPVTSWMCDAAELAPGNHLLDVGCGTGLPSLAAAARVRPGGKVVAIDLSSDMIAAAATQAQRAALDNIEFREMPAETLAFQDQSFDAVTSAFALMFSPDPARVLGEIKRVLKPGGRMVLTVWDELAKNSFFATTFQAVAQVMPSPPPDPKAPGMFRLAKDGELSAVLRAGGFSDFTIESRPFKIPFESVAQHWQIFSDLAPPVKAAASTLSEPELRRLKNLTAEALTPYIEGGRVLLTATPLCVVGRK